jgi:hypothetical protein
LPKILVDKDGVSHPVPAKNTLAQTKQSDSDESSDDEDDDEDDDDEDSDDDGDYQANMQLA